jgi:ESCRT-II complex subunit VPS22
MLGIGEFYVELSVKVAEVCLASRSRNGGIIRVSEVKEILERRGTKFQFANSTSKSIYTEEDIITSIKKLSKLGSGFRTVNVGRVIMIVSVPEELDADHMQVLNYAVETPNGMVRTETWIMNDQTELWNCCLVRVWHG